MTWRLVPVPLVSDCNPVARGRRARRVFRMRGIFGLLVGLLVGLAGLGGVSGTAFAGSGLAAFSDAEIARGFFSTVFGVEHGGGGGGKLAKKYESGVLVAVAPGADPARRQQVAAFVGKLPGLVPGLKIRMAKRGERANFIVHVVERAAYVAKARADVFGNKLARVPGRCMVKVDFAPGGIVASQAVIVSDDGDQLFERCMVEEILQGLGPVNDNSRLAHSVFNDTSQHSRFMPFDRAILMMLYDPRVRHGMTAREVAELMPDLIASTRKRMR